MAIFFKKLGIMDLDTYGSLDQSMPCKYRGITVLTDFSLYILLYLLNYES